MTLIKRVSIASSLHWILSGRAIQILIQLIGLAVLARLVPPTDFGTVALAGVAITFLSLFADLGTSAALVQRKHLEHIHKNAVFWLNVVIGCSLGFSLALLAPWIGGLLGSADIAPVLQLLALSFPLAALGTAHTALLERNSKFRALTIRSAVAAIVGLSVAIPLAFAGHGVFALVAQSLCTAAAGTALLWYLSAWRPTLPSFKGIATIAAFSGNLFAFNILNFVHRNTDTLVVGRFLGQADLGLYNLAYRFMVFPLQNITFAVGKALLPAYSRAQDDLETIAQHYLLTLRGIALVTAPLMASIWTVREPLVTVLLGPNWLPSADVIQWLAPVGFLQSIVSTSGSVLASIGRTATLRTLGILGVPFLTASFFIGLPWGIEGVAAAYCAANAVWLFPVLLTVMKALNGSVAKAIAALSLPALTAIAAFSLSGIAIPHTGLSPYTHAPIIVLTGGTTYGLSILLLSSESRKLITSAARSILTSIRS